MSDLDSSEMLDLYRIMIRIRLRARHSLDTPISRVTTPNVPLPYNPRLESHLLPDSEGILRAARQAVS
ncbi:MAG: hypothetical protein ACLFVP_04170 [Candidatus Bathyarchaeia archaeon]